MAFIFLGQKPYKAFSHEEWNKFLVDANHSEEEWKKSVVKRLEKEYKQKFEDQEKAQERARKENESLKTKLNDVTIRNTILEEERDDVREVERIRIRNEDTSYLLDERKDALDRLDAQLKDRAQAIGTEEDARYKAGYADGIADGVRKISEITQKDRDQAMKIAMVSAASHTPVQNLKEINNVQAITSGAENTEDE